MSIKIRNIAAAAISCVAITAGSVAIAAPSTTKICKPDWVTKSHTSEYGAMLVWQNVVGQMFGNQWNNWSNAADKTINCVDAIPNQKKTCFASARPCRIKQIIFGPEPVQKFKIRHFQSSRRPALWRREPMDRR